MAAASVVVVEDEPAIRRGVVDALRLSGYRVRESADGAAGLREALRLDVNLVLLDLLLPKMDGLSVLAELRRVRPTLPVIVLTARGGEDDRVRGLRMGADDYVVKPFSARELLARVEAVLRRSVDRPQDVRTAQLGRGTIDFARREIQWPGAPRVELSETEASLLSFLVANPERAVSREELLTRLWGIGPKEVETRTVDMHIARLRQKLRDPEDENAPEAIVTVRAVGYMAAPCLRGVTQERPGMSHWLRGKRGATLAFVLVASLVLSGLGWLTAAALGLEREGQIAQAQAQEFEKLRLALWRLDSLLAPVLAREDSRPFQDYSEMFAPVALLRADGTSIPPGRVFVPSPLLTDELPDWMLIHFQLDASGNWKSPQVFSDALASRMQGSAPPLNLVNRTPQRRELLGALSRQLPAKEMVALVQTQSGILTRQNLMLLANTNEANPVTINSQAPQQQIVNNAEYDRELRNRNMRQSANNSLNPKKEAGQASKSGNVFIDDANDPAGQLKTPPQSPLSASGGRIVHVTLGPMTPFWKKVGGDPERLFIMRTARLDDLEICQGVLLDWLQLEEILRQEVQDLFPDATFSRVAEGQPTQADRTLASLPVLLDPGTSSAAPGPTSWSPLRFGLILAWAAALIALTAVGLGGWSLLDLSERRFRFVSAVTHELRTPLTTLRLYLDMLAGGLIREEKQKAEYLQTLNVEADRLNRLVGNVLDFSRLENQKPRLVLDPASVRALLDETRQSWSSRCHEAGMELCIEESSELGESLTTDSRLVQQILGILIDNACKYCGEASDRRIQVRASRSGHGRLALEVEDRGPGIPLLERRSIFRAFQRGKRTEFITGGVGLGLALADRWAKLLGGRLFLKSAPNATGACFRLEIPA